MSSISKMNQLLAEYAEKIPAKGTHIGYLDNARELMFLYGNALSIMEEDETPENEAKVDEIERQIEQIVK